MAILMENLYEPGRVSPSARAPLPVGEPLPAPAKQSGALGVDHSKAPKWRVAVTVPVIQVAVESLPVPTSAPGQGPSLAEVAFPLQYLPPSLQLCTSQRTLVRIWNGWARYNMIPSKASAHSRSEAL